MCATRKQGRDIRRNACAAFAVCAAGLSVSIADAKPKDPVDGVSNPTTTTVWGVFRDFRKHHQPGGHPDFGKNPAAGDAHSMGNVADTLDADGCPVFTGAGSVVATSWTDNAGRQIHPSLFDAAQGDVAGSWGAADNGAIASVNSFRQWFRDVPGMNTSAPFGLQFEYDEGAGAWVFDESKVKTNQAIIGGGSNSNFEYSFALNLTVRHHAGDGDYIELSGMDDMWVFVDGKLVADLGGVNHAETMFVPLDRLGLVDGQKYDVKIFMTERIKQRQHLRVVLAADFFGGALPTTMGMYD
ncbi:MAG: fibro-slime domain-containing protein [Phycisphaerales bacterium]